MATITRRINKAIEPSKRYIYVKSSENADDGTVIAAGDVFRIEDSLGKPAHEFYIETAASTNLTVRFNSRLIQYKMRDIRLNPVSSPDLENPVESIDTSLPILDIGAEEVWELKGVLPISDVEIVAWTTGSFEIFAV